MSVGADQILSTTEVLGITNAAGQAWVVLDPYLGDATGTLTGGYWGDVALGRVVGKDGTSYGLADKYKHADVDAGAQSLADVMLSSSFWSSACSSLIVGMESNLSKYASYVSTTITNMDTFATYHNGQNAHTMMFNHAFAKLYYYYRAQGAMLTSTNVINTSIVLCSGTPTGTIAITFTDGDEINTVSTLAATVQGFAPDNVELMVTNGTLTGTITATGFDQDGSAAQWLFHPSGLTTADSAHAGTPGVTGDRTTDITAMDYTGDGTAGEFNIRTVSRDLTA